jgi:hypothetical protein
MQYQISKIEFFVPAYAANKPPPINVTPEAKPNYDLPALPKPSARRILSSSPPFAMMHTN